MRGKGFKSSVDAGKYRITPAYAGKRQIDSCLKIAIGDHPRLCGEKLEKRFKFKMTLGSPPPMRGKVTSMV